MAEYTLELGKSIIEFCNEFYAFAAGAPPPFPAPARDPRRRPLRLCICRPIGAPFAVAAPV